MGVSDGLGKKKREQIEKKETQKWEMGIDLFGGKRIGRMGLDIEDLDHDLPPSLTQFEPKLLMHNETMVHHILVYACGNASVLPTGISDCYGADPAFSLCSQVIVGWAVGGTVSPVMRELGG